MKMSLCSVLATLSLAIATPRDHAPVHTAITAPPPNVTPAPTNDAPVHTAITAPPLRPSGVRGFGDSAALLGGGNCVSGRFDAPRVFGVSGGASVVVVGHFDDPSGVGPLDVAVVIPGAGEKDNGRVQVLLNLGLLNGVWQGFSVQPPIVIGPGPTDMAVGRISGDGGQDMFDDLIVCNAGDDTVQVIVSDGSGSALSVVTVADAGDGISNPRGVAAADLDGDGRDDIAVTNFDTDTVTTLICPCGGLPLAGVNAGTRFTFGGALFTFGGAVNVDDGPEDIEPEDVDNDKDIDLVISTINGKRVQVLRNNTVTAALDDPRAAAGEGSERFGGFAGLTAQTPVGVGDDPVELVFKDMDGDGLADVVTADMGSDQASVLSNTAGVLMALATEPLSAAPRSVAEGDFDLDGLGELVFAADTVLGRSVAVMCNLGGLDFDSAVPIGVNGVPEFVATGDVDLDGVADIITANSDGSVSVLTSSRDTTCIADCAPPPAGNGVVNIDDMFAVINAIATQDLTCDIAPADDAVGVGNGVVNFDDLVAVINNFGACPADAGDVCSAAPIAIGGGAADQVMITIENRNASTDGPPHEPQCDQFNTDNPQIFNDIWLCYTATCGTPANPARVTISLAGSNFDTKAAVYDGCACPLDSAALLACNDDADGTLQSHIEIDGVLEGDQLLVRIGGFGPADTGAALLSIGCADPPSGACCDLDTCVGTLSEAQCAAATATCGVWIEGGDCVGVTCEPGCAAALFTNGVFDCVNGSRPAQGIGGWASNGIIDDFELAADSTITTARFDWIENTSPFAPSPFLTYIVMVYDLTGITMADLDFDSDVPVAMYVTDANDLTKTTDPTVCFDGFDTEILEIDLTDEGQRAGFVLSAGRYALFIQVADAPANAGIFRATAPGAVCAADDGRIFGPGGVNSSAGAPFAFCLSGTAP